MEKELQTTKLDNFTQESNEWKLKVNQFARQYGVLAVGSTE